MGSTIEAGTLGGRFGYLRFGAGPRTLVILPGLYLDGEAPGGLAARAYAYGFRALAATHTIYVVRRPRGLAAGTSIADLAAQYGQVLRSELGRADVVGLSTGGLIAQELALGDPDAVNRLALVVSGARIAEPGRRLCAEWLRLAEARDWRGVRASLATAVVDGRLARRLVRTLVRRSDPPHGSDADDFVVTVQAALAHDTTGRLAALSVPALLVGGDVDLFFPEPVLRATAGWNMQLRVLPAGHGLPKRHAGRLQAELAAFLAG